MTLFDNDEPEELLSEGGSALLYRGVIAPREADLLLSRLREATGWEQPAIHMYGKSMLQPRLVAWFGDPGVTYSYSGTTHMPIGWTTDLLRLKGECERVSNAQFNSALANLYRDGNDSVAWHADDEPELGTEPVIASLSLGAERRFHLRHRASGQTVRVDLPTGSVLVMSGRCQAEWSHQISKTKRQVGPRINITFRRVLQ